MKKFAFLATLVAILGALLGRRQQQVKAEAELWAEATREPDLR